MAFETLSTLPKLVPGRNSGVAYVRRDLQDMFLDYDLVEHCLEGSRSVKGQRTLYLPMPDPANSSADNLARYDSYVARAFFYNVTQRTALGLQGQIFTRSPVVKTPKRLETVVTDANGGGISIEQISRLACWFTIGYGRAGLFVDYPPTEKPATIKDLEDGHIRPTISIYGPKNVINWREKIVGSKSVLSMVVLMETFTAEDNGFETKQGIQFRELRLDDKGNYYVQLWRTPGDGITGDNYEKFGKAYYPTDGAGNLLTEIPFTFLGSKNNEPSIDPIPLLDLANLNIAHYRNSADLEEMLYIVGQPMLVIAGLSKEWYDDVLGKKIPFGSRTGLPLPVGATADLIQVESNPVIKEEMEHKERQMVALGAKVVEQKQVQRTATEASSENAAEESTLVAIAKNVSAAIKWGLEWCAVFMNISESSVDYALNTDFEISRMTSDQINSVIKSWQAEALSFTEMRAILRKNGQATQSDEDAMKEIENARTVAIENAAKQVGEETKAIAANEPTESVGK